MSNLAKNTLIAPAGSKKLPDNGQWTNRFEIKSESSNRIYIVAQNKSSGQWGCSCPGYLTKRKCKHLTQGCGLSLSQIHGNGQIAAPTGRKRLS